MYPNYIGGMFIHNQVKYIVKAGCEVKVVVPVPFAPKFLRGLKRWRAFTNIPKKDYIDMVSVYYPTYIRLPGIWFHNIACYSQYYGCKNVVRSIIDEFKPDILHAHAATVPGYLGLLIKNKYKLPLICSLRGSDINLYPLYGKYSMYLTKRLILEADQLLSVSKALKKAASAIEQPKKEIKVIYNGCDIDRFVFKEGNRTQIRNELGIAKGDKILIFIGSLSQAKGIFELIAAFTHLNSDKSNLHLLIIGSGMARIKIQNYVDSHNIANKVHIIGDRPYNEVPKYLSASDIFALPSYNEGLPNVVLEAMSCSLPVVATRVGGIPEAVENGKSGILVPMKDVDSLIKAIDYLIKNDSVAKEMGIKGRKIIENNFSWYRNAEEVIQIYHDTLYRKF